jgi:hypothetical protein
MNTAALCERCHRNRAKIGFIERRGQRAAPDYTYTCRACLTHAERERFSQH